MKMAHGLKTRALKLSLFLLVIIPLAVYAKNLKLDDITSTSGSGDIGITTTGNLVVTVALDPGSRSGENADCWVATDTPFGWFYYDLAALTFVPAGASHLDLLATLQDGLFNLPTVGIFDIPASAIPSGTYTFYLAVDMTMNGLLDGELFFDFVVVNIP